MDRSADLQSQYATFRPATAENSERYAGRYWWEWALLFTTMGNVACLLGLSAVDMARSMKTDQNSSQRLVDFIGMPVTLIDTVDFNPAFTFDLAMIVSSVLVGLMALYGLFSERKYELSFCPLMITVAIVICIPEYCVNEGDSFKLARILVCLLLFLVSIPLTYYTVKDDHWNEYHITGASDGLLGMYRRLRYFNALLKFDFFLVVLLGIFSLVYGVDSQNYQLGFFVFFVIYAALCVTVGSFAVNLERKYLVFSFVILTMFLPLLVPFEIISFKCLVFPEPLNCSKMLVLIASCTISLAILSITCRTYVLLVLLQVYRHFGYGLTDAAFAGLISNESTSLLGRHRRMY